MRCFICVIFFSFSYMLRYHLLLHSFSVCIILYTLFFLLITEGTVDLTMKEVLFFTTGIRSVPPAGFETKPYVTFQHGSDCRFPQAYTCSCCLMLPVIHRSFASFVSDFVYEIKNTHGFGYA